MAFKINLPETEVILPVTGQAVRVQPLTLRHQQAIVESEVNTLSERYKFLTELLFDRIVNKDIFNNSYDIFLQNVYDQDLSAIAYGVMSVTHKKPYPFIKVCPRCGYVNTFEVPIKDIISEMNINAGGKDQFYKEIHEFKDENTGVTFRLKLASVGDYIASLKYLESKGINILKESVNADNVLSLALKLKVTMILPALFSIVDAEGQEIKIDPYNKNILNQVYDILTNMIPDSVLDDVLEFINENLVGKYYIKYGFKAICTNPACESHKKKEPDFYDVDILTDFFPITT